MSSRPTYALMVKDAVLEGPKGTSVAGVKKHLHEVSTLSPQTLPRPSLRTTATLTGVVEQKFDVDLTSSRVKASIERAMRVSLFSGLHLRTKHV